MTPAEAAALLTVAAAFDNRKPDADQARAWALALDGLRFQDCRDAIVTHYQGSREWMMPVDVRVRVKQIRTARIAAHGPIEPPPELDPSDTAAYSAWITDATRRIADGEEVPQPQRVAIAGPPEVAAEMARLVASEKQHTKQLTRVGPARAETKDDA